MCRPTIKEQDMALSSPNPHPDHFQRAGEGGPPTPQPAADLHPAPHLILHCVECENPIVGCWCPTCNYTPSMQDMYLAERKA
jgi:hypothetical protein